MLSLQLSTHALAKFVDMTGPSSICLRIAGINTCHPPTCNKVLSSGLLDDIFALPKLPTASAASSCPSWQPDNITISGPIFAFPASSLRATCPNISQTMPYICTMTIEDNHTSISNFWSTNLLASSGGQPVSRLLLDVAVLDALGQRVDAGTHLQHIYNTAFAATFNVVCSFLALCSSCNM